MKSFNNISKYWLGGLCAALLFCATTAKASTFDFHVDINTSALTLAPNGPFSLDLELDQGNSGLAASVNISNFTFANGSATGSPTLSGLASGNLGTSVVLSANSMAVLTLSAVATECPHFFKSLVRHCKVSG